MYDTMTDPQIRQSPPRRAGRLLLSALTALVLFASGVGIGWLVSSEPASLAPASLDEVAASPTTTQAQSVVPATELPPVQSPPVVDPPEIVPGDEPVADIAGAVLPAMVQIQVLDATGNEVGVGSGVIYDPSGLILTAAHVVEDSAALRVRLDDGTVLEAETVGADRPNDIAVVRVDRGALPAAALALGVPLRVGQLAIAVGSPWGLDSTVTAGIVSAVDRPLPARDGAYFVNMIQTDASINPGNSGGALVDRDGRVIGINVSIFSESGANDGVGFAVPIDRAYRVATALTAGGRFVPGLLGVTGGEAEVGATPGAVVQLVEPGSAADDAGLRTGDVITGLNGNAVTGIADLAALVRSFSAGETVVLDVIRDGETIEVGATLGAAG